MQAAMARLERLIARRRRLVLIVWAAIVVVSVPFAGRQTENLTGGGFETKGSGSQVVSQALPQEFGLPPEELAIVLDNRAHDTAALDTALQRIENEGFKDVEGVRLDPQELAKARAQAGDDVIILPLVVTGDRDEAVDAASQLRLNLEVDEEGAEVPLHLVGPSALWAGLQQLSKEDLEQAELVGLPIVLIVLLAVFGSLAAAALPLALGVGSVIVTGAIVFWLSKVYGMSIFVTNMASMLGIGVAVDYSLFILARYREELGLGHSRDEARAVALRTSGMAVTFSGVTVIVALAGLFLIDAKVVRSMAVGAITVVAIAVIAAVTLLPALIGALGHRVTEPGKIIGRLKRKRAPRPGPSFWERWTATLMKRPLPFALGATALMLLIASPALWLKEDTAAVAMFPKDFETAQGFRLAESKLTPGGMGPIQLVVDVGKADGGAALEGYLRSVAALPDVNEVAAPQRSRDGSKYLLVVTPREGPEAASTKALVNRLRDFPAPAGATVSVGGATAQNQDDTAVIAGSLWKVAVFVLLLSFVVLLLVLRSVALPIKAVLMNALSVAAAYGVLVIVFQWGWFDGFLGFQSLGYVQAITPALLLAVVFGLSMDYEVFMLSRIKERYQATGDTQKAVAQGLEASAKTISSAAIIMVAVFAIFAGTGVPQVKEIGVGLAIAIALDATIVRLILVPTTMQLMGDWNWWLPKWLDRRLPEMDFEASSTPEVAPKVGSPA